MITAGSQVVVRERSVTQYSHPIAFRAGDCVQVGRADPEYPEWHWCTAADGREGWVHYRFLSQRTGAAVALADYSARELNVDPGARGHVQLACGAWLYVMIDDGRIGWIPEHCASTQAGDTSAAQ
jgi:SH3-like domain-containing protein